MKPSWWNLWHQCWDYKTPHTPCIGKSIDINVHCSQICISIHHLWFPEDATVVGGVSAGSSSRIPTLCRSCHTTLPYAQWGPVQVLHDSCNMLSSSQYTVFLKRWLPTAAQSKTFMRFCDLDSIPGTSWPSRPLELLEILPKGEFSQKTWFLLMYKFANDVSAFRLQQSLHFSPYKSPLRQDWQNFAPLK